MGVKLMMVKESAPGCGIPRNHKVNANHPGIHADFTLLSGYILGSRAFETREPAARF